MLRIHPNARTTPVTRAEIAHSHERTGILAQRHGVSAETIRKWRKRGASDCRDHSARPHQLSWKATEEERAIVCTLRRVTNFALDDLTFVVTHFLPRLNRDSVWRILRAEGLNRRPKPPSTQPTTKGQGTFKDYDLGFVHIDIKHLPKLQTADGERRKRCLYVAIDRRSRSVHLAVKGDETEASAIAFLREAAAAFPFHVTHVLTDNGSCFTQAFARACAKLGAEYRHIRPRTPQTTDEVDQSLLRDRVLFSGCPWVTAWRRAGQEVRARPRSPILAPPLRRPWAPSVRAASSPRLADDRRSWPARLSCAPQAAFVSSCMRMLGRVGRGGAAGLTAVPGRAASWRAVPGVPTRSLPRVEAGARR